MLQFSSSEGNISTRVNDHLVAGCDQQQLRGEQQVWRQGPHGAVST